MAQDITVTADGIKCFLYYFTGKMISSRKDKETQISSQTMGTQNNPQVHVTSTTIEHHEFFLADKDGKERSFHLTDLDFACREGHTISVVWMVPDGKERGPYIHVRNHNADEYTQVGPNQIADIFRKSWLWILGVGAVIGLATMMFLGPLALFGILVSFYYFRSRSRKAAKSLLSSPELMKLDRDLAAIKPFA